MNHVLVLLVIITRENVADPSRREEVDVSHVVPFFENVFFLIKVIGFQDCDDPMKKRGILTLEESDFLILLSMDSNEELLSELVGNLIQKSL
jgi:hypothetical protein